MPQVIEKNSTIINKEPMVLLPLREWQEIEDTLEEMGEAERFNRAFEATRNEKSISLNEIKEKYNLK